MADAKTVYAFRSRFPEFDTVKDADIAVALDTSAMWIDQSRWSINDYPIAMLFWAAHFLSLQQMQLASVGFGGTGSSDIYIRSISFGERHVVFNQRRDAAVAEKMLGPGEQMLMSTIYGAAYIQLRSRNIIPVAVI